MKLETFKKLKLPGTPGVYFFYKGTEIVYIGKATSLKDRVKSYFGKDLIETRGPLLVDMVFQADKIDWQGTDSVLEALILEASLIKKYQPKYNTKEKDDKSFNYVIITKPARAGGEPLPKVLVVRGRELRQFPEKFPFSAKFGPFTNGAQLREAMKIIRPIFPFIDAQSAKRDNQEFYRQLGLSPDVKDSVATEVYKKNIANLKLFFQGKKKRILSNFKKEMLVYAKNKQFEQAGAMKYRIFALTHINDVALLKKENYARSDASAFRIECYDVAHMSGKNMVGVMTVVENGQPAKHEYKKFKIRTQTGSNDVGALTEILERRLAHPEWAFPQLIVVDGGVAQINAAQKVLKSLKIKIPVTSVLKDERHKPKAIMGDEVSARAHKAAILLGNSEAHRFAITYHKNMRSKNFLGKK